MRVRRLKRDVRRTSLLAVAAGVAAALMGYEVQTASTPDATATSAATAVAGWTSSVGASASAGAARDLRQTTWAESEDYAGAFDSRKPTGCVVFIR